MMNRIKNIQIGFPVLMSALVIGSLMLMAAFPKFFRKPRIFRMDPNTTFITAGSFYMGPSDEQIDLAMVNRKKLVSVNSFYMDKTEITNDQYRRFVNYVADSLKYLAIYGGGINQNEDTLSVNWARTSRINMKSKAVLEKLNELLLSPDNRIQGRIDIDPTKLVYRYTTVDLKAAAKASKGLELPLSDFIIVQSQAVYPDTLVWMRDFSYSYNEPQTRLYFSHPAYNDYPVVGVTWKQAVAFCNWRTGNSEYYLGKKGKPESRIDGIYRLPTEAEWEYAARGNAKTNAMYPWGSPYTRTKEGRLMANFKPGRGDYFGGGDIKNSVYTTKVGSYNRNLSGFDLYDLAGNVAEWTSSVYYEGSSNFLGDFSPDVQFNAKDTDPILMKRKVIRGGSWKDIAYNCQVSSRNYEYQDSAKSYVGFRCVLSMGPRTK